MVVVVGVVLTSLDDVVPIAFRDKSFRFQSSCEGKSVNCLVAVVFDIFKAHIS